MQKSQNEGLDLFSYRGGAGYQKHSRTSRLAAEGGRPAFSRQAGIVLEYIASQGRTGAITDEIRRALLDQKKIHENSVMSARVRELEMAGFIVKTTEERRTSAGQAANVYVTSAIFAQGGFLRDCAKPAPEPKKKAGTAPPVSEGEVLYFDYPWQGVIGRPHRRYKVTPQAVFWGVPSFGEAPEWVMRALNHENNAIHVFAISKMVPVK